MLSLVNLSTQNIGCQATLNKNFEIFPKIQVVEKTLRTVKKVIDIHQLWPSNNCSH